ncbi:Na+/H+ antiporter subunit G [Lacimonas salitolerans]|uniref:Na+/H+ antiporter subunit G n=1 Tax=Lacimonas salitolerans TaxID=1323750 RepID=A0ABW4EH29_9RHOB
MDTGLIIEIAISAFLVIAGIFGLVGSYGLIKLPDTLQRLHAPTKATTLGVGGVLIASMLYFWLYLGDFSFHELMITLFLFLTAPISASFIAKSFMQTNVSEEDVPETGGDVGWSSYADRPIGPGGE